MGRGNKNRDRPRRRVAVYARVSAYLCLAAWSVLFCIFPPIAFDSALDLGTVLAWQGLTFVSAIGAAFGAFTGRDLKIEFTALCSMLIGPGLYFLSQVWIILNPSVDAPDPSQRIALAAFALYATLIVIPRIAELSERKKHTRLARLTAESTASLTESEKAQPGAFSRREERRIHVDRPGSFTAL